jgi:uncharacterized protein (TIGR03435 family)
VASIRPSREFLPLGGAGRGGFKDGCASVNHFELDPKRFAARNTTLLSVIWFAYPEIRLPFGSAEVGNLVDCATLSASKILSGGPDWVRSDQFDIQAVIPDDSPKYTFNQLRAGQAPQLQDMLRTLLRDRVKLVLRREMREVPVYFLTVGRGGPKFNGRPAPIPGRQFMVNDGNGNVVPGEEPAWEGITNIGGSLIARNASMSDLARHIYHVKGRPVLDRTGLMGGFDFHLESSGGRAQAAAGIVPPTIDEKIEAIGLKLVDANAPEEVWVIEHAEKPSEN